MAQYMIQGSQIIHYRPLISSIWIEEFNSICIGENAIQLTKVNVHDLPLNFGNFGQPWTFKVKDHENKIIEVI